MAFDRASLRDADVAGKKVLVRVDFNVPIEDGVIGDESRIRAALPTIEYLRDNGAAGLILASHLGRPGGKVVPGLSLAPIADRLKGILNAPVEMANDVVGPDAQKLAAELQPGEILVLENTRFEPGETENDPQMAEAMASLADVYVNDAFGAAHRAHASTAGVAEYLPAYAGILLEGEVKHLESVASEPQRPLVVVLGGSKVSDKVGVIDRFLDIADEVLIGGAMCFPFYAAQGINTGDSLVEEEGIPLAREAMEKAKGADCELVLPVDLSLGRAFDADTDHEHVDGVEVPDGWMGLDVGPATAADYSRRIATAGTVLWNGPMGAFELAPFAAGTRTVADAVAGANGFTVVGGGDSVAALAKFGLTQDINWVSTGGGASLQLLEGSDLPGVEALKKG